MECKRAKRYLWQLGAVVLLLASCGGSDESSSSSDDYSGVQSGQCIDLPLYDISDEPANEEAPVVQPEIVPCNTPHQFEVVAVDTPDNRDDLIDYQFEGAQDQALAECLGVSVDEVNVVLAERGVHEFVYANLRLLLLESDSGERTGDGSPPLEEPICQSAMAKSGGSSDGDDSSEETRPVDVSGTSPDSEPEEPTPTADPTTPVTFEDPFDGTLDDGWTWLSDNPTLWSLSDTPGWLTIAAVDEFLNVLVRDAPDGTFEAETVVRFTPTSNFQRAGLFVGTDDTSYVQLGRAYCDGPDFCVGDGVYMDNIDGGEFVDSSVSEIPGDTDVIHLRLVVDGDMVSGYFSEDGQSWTLVGEHIRSGPNIGVGLGAGQAQTELAVAEFDYFALSSSGAPSPTSVVSAPATTATTTTTTTTQPAATATRVAIGEPFVIEDGTELAIRAISFECIETNGLVLCPGEMEEGDVPLTIEFEVLNPGSSKFIDVELWLEDGDGNRLEVEASTEFGPVNGPMTIRTSTFLLPTKTASLMLHLGASETIDLEGLLPSGGD